LIVHFFLGRTFTQTLFEKVLIENIYLLLKLTVKKEQNKAITELKVNSRKLILCISGKHVAEPLLGTCFQAGFLRDLSLTM
jgi:hypothetical protein